jgi:hypothetical protein
LAEPFQLKDTELPCVDQTEAAAFVSAEPGRIKQGREIILVVSHSEVPALLGPRKELKNLSFAFLVGHL